MSADLTELDRQLSGQPQSRRSRAVRPARGAVLAAVSAQYPPHHAQPPRPHTLAAAARAAEASSRTARGLDRQGARRRWRGRHVDRRRAAARAGRRRQAFCARSSAWQAERSLRRRSGGRGLVAVPADPVAGSVRSLLAATGVAAAYIDVIAVTTIYSTGCPRPSASSSPPSSVAAG